MISGGNKFNYFPENKLTKFSAALASAIWFWCGNDACWCIYTRLFRFPKKHPDKNLH